MLLKGWLDFFPPGDRYKVSCMSAVLDFVQVSLVRQGKKLLDRINWKVEEGQKWIVLGPNGAGKTTLLALAAARLHPTSGTVDILDEVLGAVDVFELRPRIGVSSAALAQTIPAQEKVRNVVLTAAYTVAGRWKEQYEGLDDQRAVDLLAQWGVADLAERAFATLSEGERKRVLIARALMTDPELLLLDEPAAGLDIAGREDLVSRLTRLTEDPAAPVTVLVTHHLEEIPSGFTHILLLRAGQVVASGPLAQTLTQENLKATYGMDFDLTVNDRGRYSAFAHPSAK